MVCVPPFFNIFFIVMLTLANTQRYIERDEENRKKVLIKFPTHCECLIELNEAGQLSPVGWFADDISNVVWCYIQFTSDRYRLCKNNSAHLNSFYARCFSNPNASLLNAAFSCLIKHTVLTRGITHQEDLEWQKGKGKKHGIRLTHDSVRFVKVIEINKCKI